MSVLPSLEVPSVDPELPKSSAAPDVAPQNTGTSPDARVRIPAELLAEAWWFV